MSDSVNKNYPGNEAVHQRRTGISRITNEQAEQLQIDPFHNLMLKQASPTSEAMLFSKPHQEKSFLPTSSTSRQYCTGSGNDVTTPPATPGNPPDTDLETFGSFYSPRPVNSVSQMIEEAIDQLANGWIVADCNGRTRDAFPRNDAEVASQLIKALKSRTRSNMKEYPHYQEPRPDPSHMGDTKQYPHHGSDTREERCSHERVRRKEPKPIDGGSPGRGKQRRTKRCIFT
ncbi:hypothetical protein [Noviherbaspirillum sp. L7-7A]|uniref:hypothetical protein n=1 Tax=Noviherbaspirillum sp. L7-7A TaxID=2850560 RepID=UPI0020112696|nr:hypothetical protein [Noviherbaspirillum sp. L7-7A]